MICRTRTFWLVPFSSTRTALHLVSSGKCRSFQPLCEVKSFTYTQERKRRREEVDLTAAMIGASDRRMQCGHRGDPPNLVSHHISSKGYRIAKKFARLSVQFSHSIAIHASPNSTFPQLRFVKGTSNANQCSGGSKVLHRADRHCYKYVSATLG